MIDFFSHQWICTCVNIEKIVFLNVLLVMCVFGTKISHALLDIRIPCNLSS